MIEARIDLHTHTSFSEDRERIALPHGASVTVPFYPALSPTESFDLALERGMTHVTFTDHDTLAGCFDWLEQHGPDDRFVTGEEVTCYHRDVPVHVGVFGLSEEDHQAIHAGAERTDREVSCLRWNLPELVAFCGDRALVCELKHPLWTRDGAKPDGEGLVQLFGLFGLIEAINGTRHCWLNGLGRDLAKRYRTGPLAFTAGSDSHTQRIGQVYTKTSGKTGAEVLESLRQGRCEPVGPHGTHRILDDDIRCCLQSNLSSRAGQFIALADDYMRDIPQIARELLNLMTSGTIAFAVVHEYGRQRALAREVEALFETALADAESPHGEPLATPPPSRAVHGHVRRD